MSGSEPMNHGLNHRFPSAEQTAVDKKGLAWFLALTFGLSWFIMGLMWWTQAPDAESPNAVGVMLAMWVPGLISVIVSTLITRESIRLSGIGRFRLGIYHLWAWGLPVIFAVAAALFTLLLGAGQLDLTFPTIRQAIQDAAEQGTGTQPSVTYVLLLQMAFSLFVAPLFGLFAAMGEELGWRGFLLRKLLPLGQWPALLISGAVWGLWHAPLVLMGMNYPTLPVAGPFLMIGFTVLLGIILGWLQLVSGTVWVPALAHGTFNAVNGLPLLFLTGVDRSIGGPPSSIIGWIGIAGFVLWMILSKRIPVVIVRQGQEESAPGGPLDQII